MASASNDTVGLPINQEESDRRSPVIARNHNQWYSGRRVLLGAASLLFLFQVLWLARVIGGGEKTPSRSLTIEEMERFGDRREVAVPGNSATSKSKGRRPPADVALPEFDIQPSSVVVGEVVPDSVSGAPRQTPQVSLPVVAEVLGISVVRATSTSLPASSKSLPASSKSVPA